MASEESRHSAEAEHAANARRAEIRAELATLEAHAWAGEYFAGDGTGVNTSLTLAPRSGYVFEWHGCLGLYDRNYGAVTSTGRKLGLSFAFENVHEGFRGLAPELVVIPWGPRVYLVPADDVIGFCNDVNAGDEPRTSIFGEYLLRKGDELTKVTGDPELPFDYQNALLKEPVETTVLEVGEFALRPGVSGWNFRDTPLTLAAGSEQGLRIGTQLFVIAPPGLVQRLTITKVEAMRSEALMVQREKDAGPVIGWRVSTRPHWRAVSPK
ncbi:MAG: hypothetical protein ACT4PU_11640 [Planctomycetota bacterium]